MTKKNIRTAGEWAFIICAASVAILNTIKGDLDGIIWPLLAAVFSWAAHTFEEWAEDLEKTVEGLGETAAELIQVNHNLAEALRQKDAETSQLQNEIETLKNKLRA